MSSEVFELPKGFVEYLAGKERLSPARFYVIISTKADKKSIINKIGKALKDAGIRQCYYEVYQSKYAEDDRVVLSLYRLFTRRALYHYN